MKILYDLRAYQYYEKRGIGRYIYEIFTRIMRANRETIYALVENCIDEPALPEDLAERVCFCNIDNFLADEYPNGFFDVLINGAALQLSNDGGPLEWIYPPKVQQSCKIITCILYDFIPLLFDYCCKDEGSRILFAIQMEATRYVDHIFAISLFTQCSGMRYLYRPAEDFTCLYGGADETLFHSQNSNQPFDAGIRGNHLIYISGDAYHKNNPGLVRAFCQARNNGSLPEDASLYIVCRASDEMIDHLRQETQSGSCRFGKDVIVTNYIPDEEMVTLLSTARASVFPSFYEGLGLPVLESYVAGTPCWASNVSATREFVLAECSFDPFDQDAMVSAIERIYADDAICARSLEFGRKLIQTVNWDAAAEKMLNKLQTLTQSNVR